MGEENLFRLYVRAIVSKVDGSILVLKKNSDQKIAADQWLLPGGAVDFGESPEEALKRELYEEVNLKVSESKYIYHETRVIEGIHWLGLIFKVTGDDARIFNVEKEKHSAIKWCMATEVSSLLHLQNTDPLSNYLSLQSDTTVSCLI